MKNTIVLLSLLFAGSAFATRLDAPPRRDLHPVESPRKAKVLRDARATFTLNDGSLWVTHPVPAESEPSALGVTRFGKDGSARVFLLSDWLPKGSIPRGWCGQVYAVTMLTDGRIAASGGWTDGRASHNAIFILRERPDGTYATDKMFEWPGIGHIVSAPQNTIFAVTNDPSRRNGGPVVTVFDTNGEALGGHLAEDLPMSVIQAATNARRVRLHRYREHDFAIYDPDTEKIWLLNMEVKPGATIWSTHTMIFIGDDRHTAHLPIIGFEITPDSNEILVARTGVIDGKPATQLTLYETRGLGEVKQKTVTDVPWNLMLRDNDRVHGVVRHKDVVLDTVRFVAD